MIHGTGLAYLTATSIYQLGTFNQHPLQASIWLLGSAIVAILAVRGLRTIGRRAIPGKLIEVVSV